MRDGASSRRQFLARTAGVTSALGLAGCLTGETGTGNSPQSSPTASEKSTHDPTTTTGTDTGTTGTGDSTPETPRDVSFEAPHGATIHATAYGSGDCGVVLVPQINMDRGSWQPQAETIAGMGHRALAIDEDPDNRAASVRGAMRYLRQRGVSTLVLVGASTGGEAVVVANARADTRVDGTVTLSAAGGAEYASEIRGRSLFVVSEGDEDRFVRTARDLHRGAPEPTELVLYEGTAHGQRLFDSRHGDELLARLRALVTDVCES